MANDSSNSESPSSPDWSNPDPAVLFRDAPRPDWWLGDVTLSDGSTIPYRPRPSPGFAKMLSEMPADKALQLFLISLRPRESDPERIPCDPEPMPARRPRPDDEPLPGDDSQIDDYELATIGDVRAIGRRLTRQERRTDRLEDEVAESRDRIEQVENLLVDLLAGGEEVAE